MKKILRFKCRLTEGVLPTFPKISEQPQNFRHQKGAMKPDKPAKRQSAIRANEENFKV